MSWLGADVRWGTLVVDSPYGQGNDSPRGPYHQGWSILRFFEPSYYGLTDDQGLTSERFGHHKIPYEEYHHWTIIGHETWGDSGSTTIDTLSLSGDIVVFPGDTLTVESGTIVEFEPVADRHKFSVHGADDRRAEIFVYGHLNSKGAATDSVRFQARQIVYFDPPGWGGIHVMDGGSVSLSHTAIRNTPDPPWPTGLTALGNSTARSVALSWDDPLDPSITHWEYQVKQGHAEWGDWVRIDPSDWATTSHTVGDVVRGVTYQFRVQAVNRSGTADSDAVEGCPINSRCRRSTRPGPARRTG